MSRIRKGFKLILVLGAGTLALANCGIKKPPEPPEKLFPFEVKDYQVRVKDDCAELSWTYPGRNPPEKFRIQKIEQSEEAGSAGSEQAFEVPGNEFFFQDCALKSGFLYGFQVSGISQARLLGEPSKMIWINLPQLPRAPENFQALPGDRFVDFSWSAEPDLAYNLYRSQDPDQFPDQPVNPGAMKESRYSDLGLRNGKTYYYCLRAVLLQKEYPRIESKCAGLSAAPIDLIAPSAPRGVAAAVSGKAVVLKWFKNPEPDLLGYMVYRRRPGAAWKKLTEEPITETEYLDREGFKLKGSFEYAISAVDNAESKNQSPLSPPERISVP